MNLAKQSSAASGPKKCVLVMLMADATFPGAKQSALHGVPQMASVTELDVSFYPLGLTHSEFYLGCGTSCTARPV